MEQIYTIPVNEAFEASRDNPSCGCAFCTLRRKLEEREIDLILGASMMEPDIRVRTNRMGFCGRHFRMMFSERNRLGLALMLESHLAQVAQQTEKKNGDATLRYLTELDESCYICSRIENAFSKMIEVCVGLWENDRAFREKFSLQPFFCLPHEKRLLSYAVKKMNKKQFSTFYEKVAQIQKRYLDTLENDVGWFCKKFDYRYENEPWYESKDAVERSLKFLSGAQGKEGAL